MGAVNDATNDVAPQTAHCTADGNACTAWSGTEAGSCNGTTVISGRVFDPAGKNPVHDVYVWVPYTTPSPMPVELTCDCATLYTGGLVGPYALTDVTGAFRIDGAPAPRGAGRVALVVQLGKWRYQTTVPVTCGQENKIPDGSLRLPQGRLGTGVPFAGDLPNIAVSTGGADTLECLLTRIGVAESEYGAGAGGAGHVHIFQGSPPGCAPAPAGAPQSSAALWDTPAHLASYDAVLLSCEGAPTTNANAPALYSYGQMGGRVFASHYHYQWFLDPPFPGTGLATWFTSNSNQVINPAYALVQTTLRNGTPFRDGALMQSWLQNVGALDGTHALEVYQAHHSADVGYVNFPTSVSWIDFDPTRSTLLATGGPHDALSTNSTLYFSYDPVMGTIQHTCGRFVYSELHIGGNAGDYGVAPGNSISECGRTDVPSGCNATGNLSAQEKALEFMLFDLTTVTCLSPPLAP
jgi:hypothetical protein